MAFPIPSYRDIIDLVKAGATIEAQEKIMELRLAALALQEENIALREENRRLKEAQEHAAKIVRDGNCYFKEEDADRKHPFCLACWDVDRKLVSLIVGHDHRVGSTIRCNVCDARGKNA
jgi:hypothetical protein